MPINLLNDKELNDYLIELVWGEPGMPQILDGNSQENLKDAKYIEQNKDTIVRSILTQYMKHRIRAYLTENAKQSFLNPVFMRPGLPEWAVNAINGGQPVYEFEASKMTTKMRHNLTTIRDFLYSMAESYVDKTVIAIKFPTERVALSYAKYLPAALDFSNTKEVDLRYTDLSGVKEIKWPINVCHILQEDVKKMPPHIQKSYELWRANKRMNKQLKTNNNVNKIKQNLTHGMGKARD